MGGTMKRPGKEEGKKQSRGTENTFNTIIEENFPNIKKGVLLEVQDSRFPHSTKNKQQQRKETNESSAEFYQTLKEGCNPQTIPQNGNLWNIS